MVAPAFSMLSSWEILSFTNLWLLDRGLDIREVSSYFGCKVKPVKLSILVVSSFSRTSWSILGSGHETAQTYKCNMFNFLGSQNHSKSEKRTSKNYAFILLRCIFCLETNSKTFNWLVLNPLICSSFTRENGHPGCSFAHHEAHPSHFASWHQLRQHQETPRWHRDEFLPATNLGSPTALEPRIAQSLAHHVDLRKGGWLDTVDGSQIPNNHLGFIKPCKQWEKL